MTERLKAIKNESGSDDERDALKHCRTLIEAESVLALFAVGDVYASLCKRGAYTPFSTLLRLRALFGL